MLARALALTFLLLRWLLAVSSHWATKLLRGSLYSKADIVALVAPSVHLCNPTQISLETLFPDRGSVTLSMYEGDSTVYWDQRYCSVNVHSRDLPDPIYSLFVEPVGDGFESASCKKRFVDICEAIGIVWEY